MALLAKMYDWYIRKAYLLDWVIASLLFALGREGFKIVMREKTPFQRVVIPKDSSLSYPFREPRTSDMHLLLFPTLVPLLTFAAVSGLWRRNLADWHHITLAWWLSAGLVQVAVGYMSLVGRYRPNLIDGIKHQGKGVNALWAPNRSYPQIAAAAGVNSGTMMFLWAVGQMQLFSRPSKGVVLKLVIAATPLAYGVGLALTRVADYWVDFSDFNAGSFIGFVGASVSYLTFYPWITSPDSGQPKCERESWTHGLISSPFPMHDHIHLHQLQMSAQLSAPVSHELAGMDPPVFKPGMTDAPV